MGLGLMAIDAAQGCWGCALPRTWLVFVGIPVAVGGLMGATDRAEAWRAVPLTRLREGDRPARPLPLISFAVRF